MKFTEFCKQKNIQVLRDDLKFIRESTHCYKYEFRKTILKRYCDEWLRGIDEQPIAALKQTSGRRRANIWLREYVENN